MEEGDIEKFTAAVREYDSMTRLVCIFTNNLVKIFSLCDRDVQF